mgnify:CR=1 FL=1
MKCMLFANVEMFFDEGKVLGLIFMCRVLIKCKNRVVLINNVEMTHSEYYLEITKFSTI